MNHGLFYKTKKGNEYLINIKREKNDIEEVGIIEFSGKIPETEEIEEFQKFSAMLTSILNVKYCFVDYLKPEIIKH